MIMISTMYNNISALMALGTKMGVTANNVANVESEGFKKSRAVLKEGRSNTGVQVDIEKINTPGPVIQVPNENKMIEKELSNVDLVEELSSTIPTQRGYEANLKVIKSLDEMLGSVIDILG